MHKAVNDKFAVIDCALLQYYMSKDATKTACYPSYPNALTLSMIIEHIGCQTYKIHNSQGRLIFQCRQNICI